MTTTRKGRHTLYGPKDPPNRSYTLTDLAKRIAAAAADRTGASESNIVEHLLRLHGGQVTAEELAPLPESPTA